MGERLILLSKWMNEYLNECYRGRDNAKFAPSHSVKEGFNNRTVRWVFFDVEYEWCRVETDRLALELGYPVHESRSLATYSSTSMSFQISFPVPLRSVMR